MPLPPADDTPAAATPAGAAAPPANEYVDGTYLAHNPDWHAGDSDFKAGEVRQVVPAAVLDEWRRRPALRVCEIGCGAGGVLAGVSAWLESAGVKVASVGYDISPQAIALGHGRHPELELRCADFAAVADAHDVGLLIDVLEHLPDPAGFLRRVAARLEHVIAHVPLEQNLYALVRGQHDLRRREVGHLHFFHLPGALALLRGAGYDVVAWRYTVDLRDRGLSWRGRVWSSLMRAGLRVWPDAAVHTLGCSSVMALCRRREGGP